VNGFKYVRRTSAAKAGVLLQLYGTTEVVAFPKSAPVGTIEFGVLE